MDIKTYANEIANRIDGAKAEEVVKNNGVRKYGIVIKDPGSNAAPTIYIDEFYKKNMTVDEAVVKVTELYNKSLLPNVDIDIVRYYEKIKNKLTARLVNEKKNDYAGINAAEYGYDDLKIVPYIDISEIVPNGSIKVNDNLLRMWNVDIKTVVDQALENIKDDIKIDTMVNIMAEMQGIPVEQLKMMGLDNGFYVATNKKNMYGAIAGLFINDKIAEKLPYGYTVIPSSVHELIIIPKEISGPHIDAMIDDVNRSCVAAEEFLSNHRYDFV